MVFTQKNTLIAKGVAIILLFFHHLFVKPESLINPVVNCIPFSTDQIIFFASTSKICVGIFVFLSAFGMARLSQKKPFIFNLGGHNSGLVVKSTAGRVARLFLQFFFVYILALAAAFIFGKVVPTYGTPPGEVTNMIIDGLGLACAFGTPTLNPTWWYMSLAYLVIITLPLLILWYRKAKLSILFMVLLALILPFFLTVDTVFYLRYLLCIVLGIWCAERNIFERLQKFANKSIRNKILSLGFSLVAIAVLAILRTNCYSLIHIWEALMSAVIIYLCYQFLSECKIISNALGFLGKHSMNMFLTHTFIFKIYLHDFIYSFHHFLIIFFVLLFSTLLLSIFLEYLKKLTRFNLLINKISDKINGNRLKEQSL